MTSKNKIALLPDRGVVSVAGADASKLLQGIITNDMALLDSQPAIHAGLLSPQGKLLFDFFVVRSADGFLLDVARGKAGDLAKRLTMYKLRAAVTIADASDNYVVAAVFGTGADHAGNTTFPDPRLGTLGLRALIAKALTPISSASAEDYDTHRISLGIPEGGKDFVYGDTFPHEALMDQLHGVSFSKGCYVGQEIVARMEHRGTARKRVVPVVGEQPVTSSAEIKAGDVVIGTLGSVAGNRGLAMIRLDRAAEFQEKGVRLMAGDVPVRIEKPAWATYEFDSRKAGGPA